MDCGPTCLRMVARYYGKSYSLQYLRSRSYITREGVSTLGINEAAENISFKYIFRSKRYNLYRWKWTDRSKDKNESFL
jgi:ABC-type bacteriocin/lantibiotic exporter with double-glycine peptidase domain